MRPFSFLHYDAADLFIREMILFKLKKFLVAITAILFLSPATTMAEDLTITAFKGNWRGSAVSETDTSVTFPLTSRDIDVRIAPKESGDFDITWRTLMRQKGTADKPEEVLKETTLTFVRTDRPNVWRAAVSGDALAGDPISWARIVTQTLSVYVMAISEAGDYDMHVYKRTLNGLNMELDFTALRDGAVRRTAKGRLVLDGY